MSAAKAKGTRFESAVAEYLRSQGWQHVERRALNGSTDRGDITGIPGVCIEVKNQERHSLAEWLDEATREGWNADADVAAVWFKRRGWSSPASGYVLMDGATFVGLLREAGY